MLPSPIQQVQLPLFEEKKLKFYVKRDDLVHPEIMGNKWRKLKYNLEAIKNGRYHTILTFGGAYSNHIYATAALAREHNLKSIGIIRGDELSSQSNPTLKFAESRGMNLKFVSRTRFREMKGDPTALIRKGVYLLPEGGTNALAIKGVAEVVEELDIQFDYLLTSVGTGGTMAGLVSGVTQNQKVLGFSSLKGSFIKKEFEKLLYQNRIQPSNFEIFTDYHFGGYGSVTPFLVDFINTKSAELKIPFDPIYTGKALYAVMDLIHQDYFARGSVLVFLHTGGLQGIDGYNQKHVKKIL